MKAFLEWVSKAMRVIGVDTASLRNMNKALKWGGGFIVIFVVLAVIFEAPKTPEQKLAEAAAREQKAAKQLVKGEAQPANGINTLTVVLGSVSVACFALAALIEPKEPKRDGRFRTGFKNNATVRRKSPSEIRLQRGALTVGAITGLIWFFVR